jgi:hypothetical protein
MFEQGLWRSVIWCSGGYLSGDFMSQEHGIPHDGPKDSNAGGCTHEI